MEPSNEAEVEILFKFYSHLMEQDAEEALFAITENEALGHYKVDSIPFYITGIATGDLVYAEYDEQEEMLVFKEKLQASGDSIVWVALTDEQTVVDEVIEKFAEQGCDFAIMNESYFSMEVKAQTNYLKIKDRLNQLKADGVIDYAEACLSANHQY